jgi:hypothetical protein
MDRNDIKNVEISVEELIPLLTAQISQLNTDLLVSKLMIQKLQNLVEFYQQNADKKDLSF